MEDKHGRAAEWLGAFARRGLRPRSPAAFGFALVCVGAATLLRLVIDFVAPDAVPFATYFPAILIATLIAGTAAGVLAMALGALVSWYIFVPPRFSMSNLRTEDVVSLLLFFFAALAIVWIADRYRALLRRLDEEEAYRKVVVEELGHRVKNKLATVYAILRHELRGHRDVWESAAGRLRALSAPHGVIDISWAEDGDDIVLDWRERDGPPVTAPAKRSFGTNLIERSLGAFQGTAKVEFAAAGVICRMRFPKTLAGA